ncbi:hypothetical protein BN8_00858 [Fibrisoma limi BUZ 3]|uniref:Putative auto-transporter adhesin head GIN domain-containing protein n=1 Tax=Fibrisoma limi BUZ 3 TaxID=1185876 RepID=I2GDC6_9BACT|nr:head GIN domain-containing protein [Fibrisoma limi]CCH51900.1 hypothetical protein BN8_00858 [Fibrisoma limi BUZ 3]
MKRLLIFTFIFCLVSFWTKAQTSTKTLPSFDKVIVSPLIRLVLVAGEQENARLEYENVSPDKVNCYVEGHTLRIFLDDAKITVKQRTYENGYRTRKEPIYDKSVKVTAYVTYRQLSELEIRGEEEATCQSDITSDVFKLRVYGQANVTLSSLKTGRLVASIYGENRITIQSGQATEQKYRVYGESEINAENLIGEDVSTSLYGDSKLRLYASNRIGVTAFGESDVKYAGGGHLDKGLVIGDVTIRKTKPE